MNGRHSHHQPRSRGIPTGPIAHADEDDDRIETWMIGQGQEPRGNWQTSSQSVTELLQLYANSFEIAFWPLPMSPRDGSASSDH
jgi:hypothetical protein